MSEYDHCEFLRKELIPQIVLDGKLKSTDNVCYKYYDACEINEIPPEEAHMLTQCFRVKVFACSSENKKDRKTFTLVVKSAPICDENAYQQIGFDYMFDNEELWYQVAQPLWEASEFTPRYFGVFTNFKCRSIVFEDFCEEGWKLTESPVNLSLDHILCSVELIGKFHGKGYAIKHDSHSEFFKIVEKIEEVRYRADKMIDLWTKRWTIGMQRTIRVCRGHVPDDFLEKLSTLLKNPFDSTKKLASPREPISMLCHGDFLRNNMAFKYESGIAKAALMFDFQLIRYGSPMIDMCTFMANSTGRDVREQHFDVIFQTYYTALTNEYQKHKRNATNENLPDILSYDNMLREYARMLPFGYAIAAFFLGILHNPEKSRPIDEVNSANLTEDEFFDAENMRGGKIVDYELIGLTKDIYNLYMKLNMNPLELIP